MIRNDRPSPRQYKGVMISSTFTDLEDHRSALIRAIKGQGLTDVAMENDSAKADVDLIDSSLQMVRDSSAYIGIISRKYGQTPKCPQRNPKNLSITELEFDEAQKLGRPILLFIMGDKHQGTEADFETNATKRRKLKAFRERAKKMGPDSEVHRVYATFENLEEFKEKAIQAVAHLRSYLDEESPSVQPHPPQSITPSRPAEPPKRVPSSLPSQPYFFGREKELVIIAEAIAPEARTWGALIDGPGGIGKTALAIRAAHLAPESDFERKVFLSAKVRELTPQGEQQLEDFMLPNYITLLTELARELGDDNIERTDPNERPKAVRRALAEVKVLIVIDNVETFPEPERVRLYQFLSRLPTTCKAIVTSRRRADIDARVVRLDRLAHKDALELLSELARNNRYLRNATERERTDLYEITNGNPLLLKWAVAQLGRRGSQCRSVPEVCEFLKAAPANNDPLEYIFGDLLDTFTNSETAVLAALTHFKEPAKVEVIAEVSGLAKNVTLTALEDLTDRALLLSNEGQQTFLLPALAGSFLRRKRPEVIAHTGRRITDRAYALVLENGYNKFERFSILEKEWLSIAAALPLLAIGDNHSLQRACVALENFLHFSGRWDEQVTLNELAEEKALSAGDLFNAGWRAYRIGWIYYLRRKPQEILACATRCQAHWENAKDAGSREKGSAILLRGLGYELEKNYSAASSAYKEALEIFRAQSLASTEIAIALSYLADVEKIQTNFIDAERDYQEALRTAQSVDDKEVTATVTENLASLANDREDWTTAEKLAREALELAEKLGRQELLGTGCYHIGRALAGQGRSKEALPFLERAIEIFTHLSLTDKLELAQALLKQCRQ